MGLVVLAVIWELAAWIVAGSDQNLIMFGLSLVVVALVVHTLNEWRDGVLIFLVWLLFEDLSRKYLENSMTVYFGKDLSDWYYLFIILFCEAQRRCRFLQSLFLVLFGIFVVLHLPRSTIRSPQTYCTECWA